MDRMDSLDGPDISPLALVAGMSIQSIPSILPPDEYMR
jgi:hypothetical protein